MHRAKANFSMWGHAKRFIPKKFWGHMYHELEAIPFQLPIDKNHYFGLILLNKVGKITNKIFFFIKYKILTAYGFHIDFQFRDQKSLPRDLKMELATPWQLKVDGFRLMVLMVPKFFWSESLCMPPHAETCFCSVESTLKKKKTD